MNEVPAEKVTYDARQFFYPEWWAWAGTCHKAAIAKDVEAWFDALSVIKRMTNGYFTFKQKEATQTREEYYNQQFRELKQKINEPSFKAGLAALRSGRNLGDAQAEFDLKFNAVFETLEKLEEDIHKDMKIGKMGLPLEQGKQRGWELVGGGE